MQKHKLKILLVAHAYILPHKVLFCLWDAGIRNVYVLANRRGSRLRYSRFPHRVFLTDTCFDGSNPEKALAEINGYVNKLGINMVLSGDQYSTRLLTRIQSQLVARSFPVPSAVTYERLYDKWDFFNLCQQLHIRCPDTMLFKDKDSLLTQVQSGGMTYPFICKPLNLEASTGVLTVTPENVPEQIQKIDYTPVLVQQFIEGDDIGASIYCENGSIKNFIAHHYHNHVYRTFLNDAVYSTIATIVDNLKTSGVFNFDMRLCPNGDIYYLECNPRFFLKIVMSALAGINFVAAGLELPTAAYVRNGIAVRMPKLILLDLLKRPYQLRLADIRTMYKMTADPISLCMRVTNPAML